jgi:hypothetical protein
MERETKIGVMECWSTGVLGRERLGEGVEDGGSRIEDRGDREAKANCRMQIVKGKMKEGPESCNLSFAFCNLS